MDYMEFKIVDKTSHKEWCELIGCEIPSNVVRVTREFYLKHHWTIYAIQFGAAFRRPE